MDYSMDQQALFRLKEIDCDVIPDIFDPNVVMLESDISFEQFESDMAHFVKTTKYNALTLNCVEAVIFALEKAGIYLEVDRGCWCKHLLCCCYLPTPIITPKELIQIAKEYRIQNLNNQNYFDLYESIANDLRAVLKKHKQANLAVAILSQTESVKSKLPEHIDTLTTVLQKTFGLLTYPTSDKISQYKKNSFQF